MCGQASETITCELNFLLFYQMHKMVVVICFYLTSLRLKIANWRVNLVVLMKSPWAFSGWVWQNWVILYAVSRGKYNFHQSYVPQHPQKYIHIHVWSAVTVCVIRVNERKMKCFVISTLYSMRYNVSQMCKNLSVMCAVKHSKSVYS